MDATEDQASAPAGWRGAGLASVLAVALATAAGVGLIAWWSACDWTAEAERTGMAGLSGPGGAATGPLVAFSFATMGLAWLAGPFALGGRFGWAGLFRWAALIDTAGVGLFVGSLASSAVGWREGLALYAILATFAALQLALLWLLTRVGAGAGAASAAAVGLAAVACSTLLWGHLAVRPVRAGSPGDAAALAVVRYANPLLAANAALNPPTRFDWPHHGRMYRRYGIIGEARAWPLPRWPAACASYAALATVLAAAALATVLAAAALPIRRRRGLLGRWFG